MPGEPQRYDVNRKKNKCKQRHVINSFHPSALLSCFENIASNKQALPVVLSHLHKKNSKEGRADEYGHVAAGEKRAVDFAT